MNNSFRGVRHFFGGSLLNSTTILFDKDSIALERIQNRGACSVQHSSGDLDHL